jgi:radical SAM protein with 4Fe4S-binding SPASM domain
MEFHEQPFRLRELKLEVTHECPLSCVHCSSEAGPTTSRQMALEDCLRIVREAADLGAAEVAFSGGEPLVWTGLESAVAGATAAGLRVSIYTSGTSDNVSQKLHEIQRAGAKRTVLSIFGDSAESHELVTRVAGSFSRTKVAAAEGLRAGLEVEFHFVPFASSFSLLPGVVRLARSIGVGRVSVLRFVPQGRGAMLPWQVLDRRQSMALKRSIEQLRAAPDGVEIRTGSPYNYLLLNEHPSCKSGIDRLIVDPQLNIYPCDAFKRIPAETLVGTSDYSRLDKFTLRQCWESSPYFNEVRQYLTTPFADQCTGCSALETCLSGCLAQKVLATGSLAKKPDPDCLRAVS